MDAKRRSVLAAGVLAALAAGTLTLAAVRAEEGAAPPKSAAAEDGDALVKSLGDPDFAAREKAYARLKELGPAAREALSKGAESEDAQIRWSSRRLLGLIEEGGEAPRAGGRLRFPDGEETPGKDGEDGAAGGRDPWFGPRWEIRSLPEMDRAMEEMRRRMAEMEEQWRRLDRESPGAGRGAGSRSMVERKVVVDRDGERTEAEVGADGRVKVSLTRRGEDGKAVSETFEAPSLDALAKEHPGVHAKVKDLLGEGGAGGWEIRIGDGGGWRRIEEGLPRWGRLFHGGGGGEEGRAVLGVTVSEVPDLLRAHVKVPAGEGLVVEEVLPGTAAERMGLRRHDLLLSVNGIPVSTAAEVRSAVGAAGEGGALRLRILREGQESVGEGGR
ncbi:MAG: PDZ domain-containing protein [Planctomycetes bacterium]|nr:PDZ domain-containing protein [Planctomycetota bacterium]